MITILAEAEHRNYNINKKQLELINHAVANSEEPILIIMEQSPLLLWIMQNKIFEGVKNVSKLGTYINSTWKCMRNTLVKLALTGKVYIMSYDIVQILDYQTSKKAKEYFNIDLPNPWKCPEVCCKEEREYHKKAERMINKAMVKLIQSKLPKYDNSFSKIHEHIFREVIENLHTSYSIISENCNLDKISTGYMISRDTLGTEYINNFFSKFGDYNSIVICHVVHAYYSHDPTNGKRYMHTFPENTDRRFSDYSNELEPFAGNLRGDKKNIMVINGKRKFHENSLETQLLKIRAGEDIQLDKTKSYWVQSSYIKLYPHQFDYFLVA